MPVPEQFAIFPSLNAALNGTSAIARVGRPSIAPEKLLRALLLQALYSVRSERMLMEQLNYGGKWQSNLE